MAILSNDIWKLKPSNLSTSKELFIFEKNLEIFFPPPFFSFFSFYILKAIRFHISVQRPSFKWVLVSFCLFSRTSIIVGRFFYTVLNTIHNSYDDFYGLNFIMNIIQNSGVEKKVGFFFSSFIHLWFILCGFSMEPIM